MAKSMIINGKWVNAEGDKTYPLYNPANGQHLDDIANGGVFETNQAINAAQNAFLSWSKLPAKERGSFLRNAEELMRKKVKDIAKLITLENGKPFAEAQQEVLFAAGYLGWYAEEGRRAYGDWVPTHNSHKRLFTLPKPIGVIGAITPWNFPANMITRKIAPALASGCTVVLKPADTTPLTALAIGEIFLEAGFPKGIFNIITAKDPVPISQVMLNHLAVKMISFTGSVRVGQLLAEQSAKQLKRVGLELGGNAPVIVFDDANLEKAIADIIAIKFLRASGESCICANRIFVHESIYAKFVTAFTQQAKQLIVGEGFRPNVKIGPLISKQAVDRLAKLVEETKQLGGQITLGGHKLEEGELAQGNFYAPTVIANCQDEWPIAKQEIFGPVACIYKFNNENEVYVRANNTNYGLAAYIFSQNLPRIMRALDNLDYGFVGINDGQGYSHEIPVGGFKLSGIGREGGKEGLWEYLETQSVVLNLEE